MILHKDPLWTELLPRTSKAPLPQLLLTANLPTPNLSDSTYPAGFTKEDKRALRKRAQHFACSGGELYYFGVSRVSAQSINQHVKRPNYLQYSNNC